MTRQSLTCFDAVATVFLSLMLMSGARFASAATVHGRVAVTVAARDHKQRVQSLTDLVVWLQPVGSTSFPSARSGRARVLQKNKTFSPHVLPIQVGTLVEFPNADPIFHNAFSNYDGQLFDLALYPPGTTRSVQFSRTGIVRVFCNIHASMSAVILVLDTPYFTKLASDGSYVLRQIPPGNYELHIFDERSTKGTDTPILIAISDTDIDAPAIQLSEVGYARMPHKNKYGTEYPPTTVDTYGTAPQ